MEKKLEKITGTDTQQLNRLMMDKNRFIRRIIKHYLTRMNATQEKNLHSQLVSPTLPLTY